MKRSTTSRFFAAQDSSNTYPIMAGRPFSPSLPTTSPTPPQPVGQDDIRGAAAQRDLARLRARELDGLDREVRLFVETVDAHHVELPGESPGFLDRQTNGVSRLSGRCQQARGHDGDGEWS